MANNQSKTNPVDDGEIEKEILRPLWKIHILHHASERPVVGNWLLEELREHGYRVSPGTLYPLLARMTKLGWLRKVSASGTASKRAIPYTLTAAGKGVLVEVRERLQELQMEMTKHR